MLDSVDFEVAAGEAVGIVGPNGAGKTTLLQPCSPARWSRRPARPVRDQDVTRIVPRVALPARSRPGIPDTPTVRRHDGLGERPRRRVLRCRAVPFEAYDKCVEVLELCGLLDLVNRRAESLGLLHRKRLELARALATDPTVLLLDEIGGGLTDAEAVELVSTIQQLRSLGVSVVWIEHIVHLLLQVIDRLVAMDAGRVIANGDPQEVLRDATVVDAYLGKAGP